MKKLFVYLCFLAGLSLVTATPFLLVSCKSAPTERTTEVKTLKVIGASADASMKLATQLLADGKITREQWNKIANFFDTKFQPAFGLAVTAVRSDLNNTAPSDVIALSVQLAGLVAAYIPEPKTK